MNLITEAFDFFTIIRSSKCILHISYIHVLKLLFSAFQLFANLIRPSPLVLLKVPGLSPPLKGTLKLTSPLVPLFFERNQSLASATISTYS